MPATNVHEIADGVYRLSTSVPDVMPGGFTFNQFLLAGDQPMLFHTGPRGMYPSVAEAVSSVVDPGSLRWVSFGHVEADECGAVNLWLAGAAACEVAFNPLGCDLSLNDLCDRAPVVVGASDRLDLGGHVVQMIPTPHVPHGWEAQVCFDETTRTLFCGDLFSQGGDGPALLHDGDIVGPAIAVEEVMGGTGLTPATAPTIRALAELAPRTLAIMHGPSFAGDCTAALLDLADAYGARLEAALDPVGVAG